MSFFKALQKIIKTLFKMYLKVKPNLIRHYLKVYLSLLRNRDERTAKTGFPRVLKKS